MPQVNLSTLTGRELRQLLDASRARGDAALSYMILQEMASRREAPVERRPFAKRRPAAPRLAVIELRDPMEADDLPPSPGWRPPAQDTQPLAAVVLAAPADSDPRPPLPETDRPLRLREPDPPPPEDQVADADDRGLQLGPVETRSPPASRRPRLRLVAGFALGVAVGGALGWWASGVTRERWSPPATPIRTAALTPSPAAAATLPPPSATEPAPEGLPDLAAGSPPPELHAEAPAPANAQASARDPDSRAMELPPPPPPPPPQEAEGEGVSAAQVAQPAAAAGCAAELTPADRAICGDPKLQRLRDELRRAYAEALAAHQDRALLRQRQLAWRDARNSVADPERLAQLYEQRIRKLNAATAQARQQR